MNHIKLYKLIQIISNHITSSKINCVFDMLCYLEGGGSLENVHGWEFLRYLNGFIVNVLQCTPYHNVHCIAGDSLDITRPTWSHAIQCT